MQIGHVQNGTHAGWRVVRLQNKSDWTCPDCGARMKYYWVRCVQCGHPRKEA